MNKILEPTRSVDSSCGTSLSVVVLAYNEGRNLTACLKSVAGWVQEIFVVDSGSTDDTLKIAERYGAKVISHPFESHAKQWNWAFDHLPMTSSWILSLDSDHRITPELANEIVQVMKDEKRVISEDIHGFYMKRRQIFRNQWIKHGGYYPKRLLKLFRKGKVRCDENELLDFRFYVEGKTENLKHDLIEDNQNELDITFWIAKHNRFAVLQAQEEFKRRQHKVSWLIKPLFYGSPDQRILWLKERWYRMPIYIRPFLYFFYRYFLRFGFLDGKQGFIFHFLQGFWYRLLVDIKLDELRQKKILKNQERSSS